MVGGYEHIQERGTMKLLSVLSNNPTGAYLSIKQCVALSACSLSLVLTKLRPKLRG